MDAQEIRRRQIQVDRHLQFAQRPGATKRVQRVPRQAPQGDSKVGRAGSPQRTASPPYGAIMNRRSFLAITAAALSPRQLAAQDAAQRATSAMPSPRITA